MKSIRGWLMRHYQKATNIQQHIPSSMGTLVLPAELIFMIAENLDAASTTSLSLTCRSLNRLIFPTLGRLKDSDKQELLILLEKDTPSMFFCHCCIKLHSQQEILGSLEYPSDEKAPCRWSVTDHGKITLVESFSIPYYIMRLVMNRQLNGPTHGLPLEFLQRQSRHSLPRSWEKNETLDARVIDNSLLTLSVKTYWNHKGRTQDLREALGFYRTDICSHVTILQRGVKGFIKIPEILEDSPGSLPPYTKSFKSCAWCMTDFCIELM
ncbi:unnamed protein product [Periconia digitata]|uniref:F-box domain-containing protein n=1 Tax=Periconia digitata TaxID=1303443 RepID=A0A9W4UHE4_9PLEO|nr:unnamed protein product [Periconia digitata]